MSYPDLYLLIDGQRLGAEGRRTVPVINPATEEVLGQLPLATAADLDRALEAAQRSWPVWRALGPQQRGRILRKAEGKRAILYELLAGGTVETRTSERRRDHSAYK